MIAHETAESRSPSDSKRLQLISKFTPKGDQPAAIRSLKTGLEDGLLYQTLLGVTGSGKTYTIANLIAATQRPTLILAPNKTLAAQLYSEMRDFFPGNSVEYFVSYYDYYQPEAYVPSTDTYIEKDSSINEHIDQMRLSATKALLERRDSIIVATVSAIYGLGDPGTYHQMILHLQVGAEIEQRTILQKLIEMQYLRNEYEFKRGTFRVRGDVIDVYPAESEQLAVRILLFGNEIEQLSRFDPLTGSSERRYSRLTIYPKSHYVTDRPTLERALIAIEKELEQRLHELYTDNRLLEAQRLEQRTRYDLEMIREIGYCSGIENYSRFLSDRKAGAAPPTLLEYLPEDALLVIDESHVTIPQLGGMYRGDRSRKETLVHHGFRLPSALDNRPLNFTEFINLIPQCIFVSATPGNYEQEHCSTVVDQLVRPTGLIDPAITIRPAVSQVDDLLSEVRECAKKNQRVLVTTLTKRSSEDLTDYLFEHGVRVRYLHSDIDTVERVTIIQDLRAGVFDVLIGINLLREGLDIPEVSLVAILDADKVGFLRSKNALIQTIGRAARNIDGRAIFYAEQTTTAMAEAIAETDRRRERQLAYNRKHKITPTGIYKDLREIIENSTDASTTISDRVAESMPTDYAFPRSDVEILKSIKKLEKEMTLCARELRFEQAADLRDKIVVLRNELKRTKI